MRHVTELLQVAATGDCRAAVENVPTGSIWYNQILDPRSVREISFMAFNNYTGVAAVVKKHKLRFVQAPLVPPDQSAPLFGDYFR